MASRRHAVAVWSVCCAILVASAWAQSVDPKGWRVTASNKKDATTKSAKIKEATKGNSPDVSATTTHHTSNASRSFQWERMYTRCLRVYPLFELNNVWLYVCAEASVRKQRIENMVVSKSFQRYFSSNTGQRSEEFHSELSSISAAL